MGRAGGKRRGGVPTCNGQVAGVADADVCGGGSWGCVFLPSLLFCVLGEAEGRGRSAGDWRGRRRRDVARHLTRGHV